MAKIFSTQLEIYMEGLDEPLTVTADQRDYAALEGFDQIGDEQYTLRQRYLAWHAAKRTNVVSVAWKEFNERLCIQASTPDAGEEPEESEDEQGLDPGQKTASDG
jgi:hypothetical protein